MKSHRLGKIKSFLHQNEPDQFYIWKNYAEFK